PENSQRLLVNKLSEHHIPVVVVASKNPYALHYFPGVSAYINTYEPNLSALKMAAGAIFCQEEVNGKLPMSVPQLYNYSCLRVTNYVKRGLHKREITYYDF